MQTAVYPMHFDVLGRPGGEQLCMGILVLNYLAMPKLVDAFPHV